MTLDCLNATADKARTPKLPAARSFTQLLDCGVASSSVSCSNQFLVILNWSETCCFVGGLSAFVNGWLLLDCEGKRLLYSGFSLGSSQVTWAGVCWVLKAY